MAALSDLFRNMMQLGYVAADLDAAVDHLESTLGTVSCQVMARSSLGGKVEVDGEMVDEWVIDVALVNAGPTNIEVIRPVSGAVGLYREGVRERAPATFHHVGFRVDDFDVASAIVAASGRSWKQQGASGGIRFGYLDLRDEMGHFVEVMELSEGASKYFAWLEALSDQH